MNIAALTVLLSNKLHFLGWGLWVDIDRPSKEQRTEIWPPHDKPNKTTCAPCADSDQSGHPPSLIRVFTVHLMGS